jgi:hypothetical protein
MLIGTGKFGGWLAEGKAKKFAEAVLFPFDVVKAMLCFGREGFLQANPVRGRPGSG